jgi:hypothetical protein
LSIHTLTIHSCACSSKNTIRVQPVSKQTFGSNETIILRLPTNAIIDLHTLVLSMDAGAYNFQTTTGGSNLVLADFPRYVQSLFRRVDVTAGGVQVGLGSLQDYGAVWNLLAMNTIGQDKHNELAKYELGGELATGGIFGPFAQGGQDYLTSGNPTAGAAGTPISAVTVTPTGATSAIPTQRLQCSNWLGVLGGDFMRFLDTNLLPDVEIRITLNSKGILVNNGVGTGVTGITAGDFQVTNLYLAMEVISFGDDSYRRMLDSRLSTGDPIIVPFTNWANFESSNGGTAQSSTTQFTVATQSLNAVYGTTRLSGYDSIASPFAIMMTGPVLTPNGATAKQVPMYQFKSLDVTTHTATTATARGTQGAISQNAKYQVRICDLS